MLGWYWASRRALAAGRADFIVSGDRHLLNLREHLGIRILSPAAFAEPLGSQA